MSHDERTSLIQTGPAPPKLMIERHQQGAVTCLRLSGTIDEQFDGPGLAHTLSARYLILDLGGIERISSFGIRQWIDFVNSAAARVSGLYYVECAPKIMDQFNMVANFGGSGHIISFYAPYRCDTCESDRRRLFRTDEETPLWRAGQAPTLSCPTCNSQEYFDEDPATYFSFVAQQQQASYAQEVMVFLRSQLSYGQGGQRKLKIEKRIDGRVTYVKLSGDLDSDLRAQKLAEGLEGEVVFDVGGVLSIDPVGMAQWRRLLQLLDGKSGGVEQVDGIHLMAVPPAFLERLCRTEDLGRKGQVLSVLVPYNCSVCRAVTRRMVDFLTHGGELRAGRVPRAQCSACNGPAYCVVSETWLSRLRALQAPQLGDGIHKTALRLYQEASPQSGKHSTALSVHKLGPPTGTPLTSGALALDSAAHDQGQDTRPLHIIRLNKFTARLSELVQIPGLLPGLLVVLLSLSGAIVYRILVPNGRPTSPWTVVETSQPRPAWAAQKQGQAKHTEQASELAFIGESPPVPDREDAIWRAQVMTWVAVAAHVGDAIAAKDPAWRKAVLTVPAPSETQLSKEALSRVFASLRTMHRDLVDQTRFEVYWEKLNHPERTHEVAYRAKAKATFGKDVVDRLMRSYGEQETALKVRVHSYFPLLSWRYDVLTGVVVAQVEAQSPLASAGVEPGDIIVRIGELDIRAPDEFRRAVERAAERPPERDGPVVIKVQRGARSLDLEWRVAKRRVRR